MDQTTQINKDVNIVAYYFHNRGRRLRCYPKRMEWNGRSIEFTEAGLRHPTKKGQRMVHVFDMSDGNADYRLEFDAEALNWLLVSVSEMSSHAAARLAYTPAS